MNIEYVKNSLNQSNFDIIYFKKINSTNDYAKENKLHSKTLIIADEQENGRGKGERKWYTTKGKSIAMSIFLEPRCTVAEIKNLTLEVAEIVKTVLDRLYSINLDIKIPNDLLLNNKKICGILIETSIFNNIVKKLIIGIGINVNEDKMNSEIFNSATSLKIETGKEFCREDIIIEIHKKLEKFIETY